LFGIIVEGWDLTLTVVGLGVASAAAAATLVDRYVSGKWWWERLGQQTQKQGRVYAEAQTETPVLTFSPYGPPDTARKGLTYKSLPETFPAVRSPHKYSVVESVP
jgi:hypothetical protein